MAEKPPGEYRQQENVDRAIDALMRRLLPGHVYVMLYTESGSDEINIASNVHPKDSQSILAEAAHQMGMMNNAPNN